MSQCIVDTSIVIQFLIADVHSNNVQVLFDGLLTGDVLAIPEFCLLECTNVLWKQVRFQGMSITTAEILLDDLLNLPLAVYPAAGLLSRALEIGLKHQLAIYDSVYIALAEQLGYPLITDDAKQAKAATAEGILLKPITDFVP